MSHTRTCNVHGPSVTGHQPIIKFKFTATITRQDANVKVALTDMTFWTDNGGYGYPMTLYAKVTNGSKVKLDKSTATTNTTWTRHPSNKTLTSPNNLTSSVTLSVGVYSSDKKHCYSSNPTWVKSYTFTAPDYNKKLIITYDGAGGVTAEDESVAFTATSEFYLKTGGEILSTTPVYPVYITYHTRDQITPTKAYRAFDTANSWDTNDSPAATVDALHAGTTYPGGTVTANLTVFARWLAAEFTVQSANEYIAVTFDPGPGGSVDPAVMNVPRSLIGYALTPDGNREYTVGDTGTTDTDLDLYPICGAATLYKDNLPIPTLPGYTFEGWYKDTTFTEKVTEDLVLTEDITLYARYYKSSLWRKDEDGTWHRLYDTETPDWQRAPKVYKCVEEDGVKVWKKIAQMYRCTRDEGTGQVYWEEW